MGLSVSAPPTLVLATCHLPRMRLCGVGAQADKKRAAQTAAAMLGFAFMLSSRMDRHAFGIWLQIDGPEGRL